MVHVCVCVYVCVWYVCAWVWVWVCWWVCDFPGRSPELGGRSIFEDFLTHDNLGDLTVTQEQKLEDTSSDDHTSFNFPWCGVLSISMV